MVKATDAQILSIRALSRTGKSTIAKECRKIGISPSGYHKRLIILEEQVDNVDRTTQIIQNNLPITLERLDTEANNLLEELKIMRYKGVGYDSERHDKLDVIREMAKLVTGYYDFINKMVEVVNV